MGGGLLCGGESLGFYEESDLRAGLKAGGRILGGIIVARGSPPEFVVYVRCSWLRGRSFRLIRSWRGTSGDRSFKSLDSAWQFFQKFEFTGRITVYPAGDPGLRSFAGLSPRDLPQDGDREPNPSA